jgi:hypothetical protein
MTKPDWSTAPSDRANLGRRNFLGGVVAGGAASLAALQPAQAADNKSVPSTLRPNSAQAAAETGVPHDLGQAAAGVPGSDFMVDVIKALDIKYIPSNAASSFRALHESIIDYGGNIKPLGYDNAFVRDTRASMPPSSEKVLSNQDMADLHAYLKSIPANPDFKTIPLRNTH